jgi:hypothetical protein
MATYYFVIHEDDTWWVRINGKSHGGYLMRGDAVRHAIRLAGKCSGEACVIGQMPSFRWRLEWSNRPADAAARARLSTEIQRIAPLPRQERRPGSPQRDTRRTGIIHGAMGEDYEVDPAA